MRSKLLAILAAGLLAGPMVAQAQYSYTIVAPQGAVSTQVFGINNGGKVVGTADDGSRAFSFVYDMKNGEYTDIGEEFSALGINNSGVMVGDVGGVCAIRDTDGTITTFTPPSYQDEFNDFCQARAVNSNGKIAGFAVCEPGISEGCDPDPFSSWTGFIYDHKKGNYEEFLPSLRTIAQGINASGENVGSVFLTDSAVDAGSPPGRYGYLREKNGSVKYFSISQSLSGTTRARGISESGLIVGFSVDPVSFEVKGFVTTLSKGTGYEEITLSDDQVLHQKPCNPADLPPAPGDGYELFTDMFPQQIRNDGVIVGNCRDVYYNESTGDLVLYSYGFIATPTK